MKEYQGSEAIEKIVEEIDSCDLLSNHNRELLNAFKDWLLENQDMDGAVTALYTWSELCQHLTFELDEAVPEDINGLLEHAPEHSEKAYRSAVTLFFEGFLGDKTPV